jgi:hypothetical protein
VNWKHFSSLIVFIILALSLVIVGLVIQLDILHALALAIIALGLGVHSLTLTLVINERLTKMEETLAGIENLQQELIQIQKESSDSSVIPTLKALSQLSMDYLSKQQNSEDQKPKGIENES